MNPLIHIALTLPRLGCLLLLTFVLELTYHACCNSCFIPYNARYVMFFVFCDISASALCCFTHVHVFLQVDDKEKVQNLQNDLVETEVTFRYLIFHVYLNNSDFPC